MAMKLCAAVKHYYDPALYANCPYCASESGAAADPAPAGGMAGSFSDGLSGNANTDRTVFSPPPVSIEKTQMLPNPNAAEQSAKTQILADAAPTIAQDDALKAHIFGANRAAQPEARAKGMRELSAVGWLVITQGAGRGTDFHLVQGSNRIGRNAELEISLDFGNASDPAVSRETNATIVYDPQAGEFFVERGESRNLPLLNGKTIRGEPVLVPATLSALAAPSWCLCRCAEWGFVGAMTGDKAAVMWFQAAFVRRVCSFAAYAV